MVTKLQSPTTHTKPAVTIVIPIHNDEEYLSRAIDSCINQTLSDIEIICVDDKSTDNSTSIVEEYSTLDPRVKLVRQKNNLSALQARRAGIEAARADFIIFVDGDDELDSNAAKLCLEKAISTGADVVGFGTRIVTDKGRQAPKFEKSLQPQHTELKDINIIKSIFSPDTPGQGHIWGYLFDKSLLLKAYDHIPKKKTAYRANDVMVSFVALSYAQHYVSINKKLYTYYFHSGSSGHENIGYDKFLFYAQAIDSVNSISKTHTLKNFSKDNLPVVRASYQSLRLHTISNVIQYCTNSLPAVHHEKATKYLVEKIGLDDTILALSVSRSKSLARIRPYLPIQPSSTKSKKVAVFTANLSTGGVQGVAISQAKYLLNAGYDVTLIIRMGSIKPKYSLPAGIKIEKITGSNMPSKINSLLEIIEKHGIDTIIDHNILYNSAWPFYALSARSRGVKTIGWIHSFSLRPAHDSNQLGSFLNDHLGIMDAVVTLSKKDVAYWKIHGHKNIYYLPNPPSPLIMENPPANKPKKPPTDNINIIWYGRLQQSTKRLFSLVEVAEKLRRMNPNFSLRIIGPDSDDFTAKDLNKRINQLDLGNNIHVVGEKHGDELIDEINNAHIFAMTSDIEGYPLVISEVQSFGLPVVMFEMPWLAVAENNKGLLQVPQGDAVEFARQINEISGDKPRYTRMSKGSIDAAKQYLNYDFSDLYDKLLKSELPYEYSTDPTIDDAKMLLEWHTRYLEMNARYMDRKLQSLTRLTDELRDIKSSRAYRTGESAARPFRKANTLLRSIKDRIK